MKRSIIIFAVGSFTVFLNACSSRDEKMCACLKASDELNQYSAGLFQREATEKDAKKMKELKAEKTKKCASFQTMSGDEMREKKASCSE